MISGFGPTRRAGDGTSGEETALVVADVGTGAAGGANPEDGAAEAEGALIARARMSAKANTCLDSKELVDDPDGAKAQRGSKGRCRLLACLWELPVGKARL